MSAAPAASCKAGSRRCRCDRRCRPKACVAASAWLAADFMPDSWRWLRVYITSLPSAVGVRSTAKRHATFKTAEGGTQQICRIIVILLFSRMMRGMAQLLRTGTRMRITAGQQMLLRPSQVNEPASSAKQITQLLDSTSVNKAWCRCVLGVDHGLIMSSFMMAASCGGPRGGERTNRELPAGSQVLKNHLHIHCCSPDSLCLFGSSASSDMIDIVL